MSTKKCIFCPYGGVAEWSNAPHLKCGVPQGTVSSNLTPSARLATLNFSKPVIYNHMKTAIKWIVGIVLILWILSATPSFLAGLFWSESNAPWEKVDAFYYPDANNLSKWESQMDVSSVQACRDWVEDSAAIKGDPNLEHGDYECGVGCKSRDGFNVCRLTVE